MKKPTRQERREARIEKLRQEPAFKALVAALRQSEAERVEAFREWTEQEERTETTTAGAGEG